jgi:hypothetical protein
VEVEAVETQGLAAGHLLEERLARLFKTLALGVAEVYQVTVVREYLMRSISTLAASLAEALALLCGKRWCNPLSLIFGKECKGCCTDCFGVVRGIFDTSCGTDVSSKIFHIQKGFIRFVQRYEKLLSLWLLILEISNSEQTKFKT